MVKNQRNSCCHMGCPPMIGDLHFHRGYSLRLQESKPLKNNGIISNTSGFAGGYLFFPPWDMGEGFPLLSTFTETTLSSSAVACLNANVLKGGPGKLTAVPVWLLQVDTGIGFLNLST